MFRTKPFHASLSGSFKKVRGLDDVIGGAHVHVSIKCNLKCSIERAVRTESLHYYLERPIKHTADGSIYARHVPCKQCRALVSSDEVFQNGKKRDKKSIKKQKTK